MNNNNNGAKGKESDIITKKGFLISLPSKKKDMPEGASSINLAKSNNEEIKNNPKSENNDKKNNSKHHGKFNKNKKHSGNDKNQKSHTDKNDRDNNRKENIKNEIAAQNNQPKQKGPGNDNQAFRDAKPNNHKNRHSDKKDRVKDNRDTNNRPENKNEKNDRNNRQDFRDNRQNKNSKFDRNTDKNTNKNKQTPLSALSGDIAGNIKLGKEALSEVSSFSELSLEEKYKNAKPLAEQIAEQEMRQKGIKIPYDAPVNAEDSEKTEIVGIRFREAGKIYYFDPDGKQIAFGTPVIVETARGSEYGFTAISNRMIPVSSLTAPLKKIERIATAIDTQKHEANKALEKDAEKVFIEKVEKLNLAMNLIYVEYTFDNSRLLFYFTAETRIDFRELVKELASVFRTRIELRQIGVRDEAKMIGGLGVCGRATCCNTFLGDFAQVSIKMAKDQSLSLNAAKISGACGKLMCCLRYEDKVYEEENARTPKVGSIVETAEGRGHVVERNALKGIVNVQLDLAPEAPAKPFPREEVMVIGFNKDKSDDDFDSEELKSLQDS